MDREVIEMDKADLIFLLDYSIWANQKLSDTAMGISPQQFMAACPTTYGSLRGLLVHILVAHQVWRSRCCDGSLPARFPAHEEFPDYASYAKALTAEESAWRSYLQEMPEQDVQREVVYYTSRGEQYQTALWQIVLHLVIHTTQHRSEAAEVLTQMGYSPGDLDLIWYLRRVV